MKIRVFLALARFLAILLAIVGYIGVLYAAAHYSAAAALAITFVYACMIGALLPKAQAR